ncbi:MAG TPA: hypothetical protein VJJ52_07575 [Candidatus Nanoarchaeia archaeon]|nr:hypothetical protein [Candidatus Nanoarchaeia archaeon]
MKKFYLLFLISLLSIPVSFADISIQTDQEIYNLRNNIKVSASVLESSNFEGLFKLDIACSNYKLQYFITPISLESNSRTAVSVPELTVTSSMIGSCTIAGTLATTEETVVGKQNSNYFGVTNLLTVLPVNAKIKALPGDTIQVAAVVNEAYGNNVLKAPTKITLDSNVYPVDVADGRLNFDIVVPKNIRSGLHFIEIDSYDLKGNAGSNSIELEITAVPSYVMIEISSDILAPGSKTSIMPLIYDQADDLINDSLELEMTSPKNDKVFKKLVNGNDKLEYEFSQYAQPGVYKVTATYKNLVSHGSLTIGTIRDVQVKYENESVSIENIGNVPYTEELTFVLQNEIKKYLISKKINIEPGKILFIDLSKEVPGGVYRIILPLKKDINAIQEAINQTARDLSNIADGNSPMQKILAENAIIHDNRPIYKKITTGISSISASLVGSDGAITQIPWLAPLLFISILLVLLVRYGKKPIAGIYRKIKGKKEDNKEKLDKGN